MSHTQEKPPTDPSKDTQPEVRETSRTEDAMIRVENLTKRYTGAHAIMNLSFEVKKGEIVGFLGPNGAGKTTTLRILSCFMPATSGMAYVAGYNCFTESEEVRRRIGYMPENNPLHMDMRVREYLKFRSRLKGLSRKNSRTQTDLAMEKCRLTDVSDKIIGQLSKGYKQRVGLADALVHDPDLLLLDEPTIGLDPNQIRSFRELIKELGQTHTVLISSHILPEIELTCNRVLIMHRGKLLAADTPEKLRSDLESRNEVYAEIKSTKKTLTAFWNAHPDVSSVDITASEGSFWRVVLTPKPGADLRAEVFKAAREQSWGLRELRRQSHTLEDVFVSMTQNINGFDTSMFTRTPKDATSDNKPASVQDEEEED